MKNKQFVEYSEQEKRFKIDQLLYLDVDSQSRAELIDLFGILSDNPTYRILVKRTVTTYLLAGIALLLLLMFSCVYFQFRSPMPVNNTDGHDSHNRLLSATPSRDMRLLQSAQNSMEKDTYTSGPFDDYDENNENDFYDDYYNTTMYNTKMNKSSDVNPMNDTNTSTPVSSSDQSKSSSFNSTNQTEMTSNKTNNSLNNPNLEILVLDDENISDTPTSFVLLYVLFCGILVLFISLAIIECRKKQIFDNLKVFEETTLKGFHNKMNNRIIVTSCHERMVICSLNLFSIYDFKFLVHNNGTEGDSLNGQKSIDAVQIYNEMASENSIYKTIEDEGEKYHNAVINLNKQLGAED